MTRLALDCVISRNTAQTYAAPTWNPLELVKDATLNLSKAETDVTTRGSGGWAQTRGTIKEAELSFEMAADNTNGDFTALRDAWLNGTQIDLAVLDGAANASGSQGLRALWEIIGFTRNENLREAVTYSITAKPGFNVTNPPVWMTVT